MLPLPFYYTLLAFCSAYALYRGSKPERIGVAIMVVGSLLTLAVVSGPGRFGAVEVGVFVVDVAAFAAFTILALHADRFWPIWVSALAGLGVLGHLGRWYAGPVISRGAYAVSLVIWSYAILAVIAIGTRNHQRRASAAPAPIAPRAKV